MIASIYRFRTVLRLLRRGHQNENSQIDMKIETMARRVAFWNPRGVEGRQFRGGWGSTPHWSASNWAELNERGVVLE